MTQGPVDSRAEMETDRVDPLPGLLVTRQFSILVMIIFTGKGIFSHLVKLSLANLN